MQDLRRAVERSPFAVADSVADVYETLSGGGGFSLNGDIASDHY